jgi:hypothetical protein
MTKPKQRDLLIHSVEQEEPGLLPKYPPDFLVPLVNDAIASCRGPRNGVDVKAAVERVLERLTDEQRGHLLSEVAPTVYGLLHGDIERIDESVWIVEDAIREAAGLAKAKRRKKAEDEGLGRTSGFIGIRDGVMTVPSPVAAPKGKKPH